MKHQTRIVETEITVTSTEGFGFKRINADRVMCSCGFVSVPFLDHDLAIKESWAHLANGNRRHDANE